MKNALISRMALAAILLSSVFATGCAKTFRGVAYDEAIKRGWTKEQALVVKNYVHRIKFTKENADGGFDVVYAVLPNEEVTKIVRARLEDLDYILDYNNKDWAKFIKEFGLREDLEKQEKEFKGVYARLQLVDNFNKFKELTGQVNYYRPRELDTGFDSAKVFAEDVFAAYPFSSDLVERAKKDGKFKEVERFVWLANRKLDHKEADPSDPTDGNKFVWKSSELGMQFVAYKVLVSDRPQDNSVDYVEGTRMTMKDGTLKPESKPALRLFVPGGGYSAVLLIDKDKEGEIGFMLPDFVEGVSKLSSASSLVNDGILSRLFPDRDKSQKRIAPPPPPPIVVEIAPVGKNKIDVWEVNPSGWTVPFDYKNEATDNFSVSLKIKGAEDHNHDPSSRKKQIEFFKKTWSGIEDVVEYFKPKTPYDQPNIMQAHAMGTRVHIVFNNGEEVSGFITPDSNKFINDKPVSIEFTEGDQRWLINDENGDGKYERRRMVSDK